jgi:hypothetical protein
VRKFGIEHIVVMNHININLEAGEKGEASNLVLRSILKYLWK